jgi:isopentenyl phosphate kinase
LKGHDAYIIKLGGSVITKKDKKYETDVETLCRIASYLSISKPSVIVHGGGSFGHYIVNEILQRKERLETVDLPHICLLYTSPSPRDRTRSRMPSSA